MPQDFETETSHLISIGHTVVDAPKGNLHAEVPDVLHPLFSC
jgi:hypothetical protein